MYSSVSLKIYIKFIESSSGVWMTLMLLLFSSNTIVTDSNWIEHNTGISHCNTASIIFRNVVFPRSVWTNYNINIILERTCYIFYTPQFFYFYLTDSLHIIMRYFGDLYITKLICLNWITKTKKYQGLPTSHHYPCLHASKFRSSVRWKGHVLLCAGSPTKSPTFVCQWLSETL